MKWPKWIESEEPNEWIDQKNQISEWIEPNERNELNENEGTEWNELIEPKRI